MIFPFLLRLKTHVFIISAFLVSPFFFASFAAAASLPPPDSESRSFIVGINAGTIAGNADRKTASARLAEHGKQIAIEKIRTRLAGQKGPDLDFEFIKTTAGLVKVLKQEEASTKDSKKPFLWLETEGAFILRSPKTGARPEAKTLDQANFLDVRLWTDKKEYKNGEKIVLYLQGNRDFQGKVIKIDPKGNVHQILPNNYRQLSSFEKNKHYLIPDEGDRYGLSAQPPFGTVRFVVYATSLPMSQVNLSTTTGGIFKYRSSEKFFGRSVRHIVPSGEELLSEFYEARWEIKTIPGK